MSRSLSTYLIACLLLAQSWPASSAVPANGTLSANIRISSRALCYDLQYRVYTLRGIETAGNVPVLFITDGPGYISRGVETDEGHN